MTPVQTIESVYAAFNRGDIAHIVSLVAPNADWRQSKALPWGGDYKGPQGAAEFFQKLDANVETTGFVPKENIAVGDEVLSFGTYAARSRKTGKSAEMTWMFRWRVKDGKIVMYDSYVDSGLMLSVLN